MTKIKILISVVILFLSYATVFAAEVTNENVRQVGNRILFEFDVTGEHNEDADVNFTLTFKGKNYSSNQLHLEGDYGKTKAGKGKKIYWNVLQDFPRGLNTTVHWNLSAGGGKLVKDPTTGIEMVFVKGGCYQMGDTFGDGDNDEKPVHEVCVNDFYIGKYEVTQGQWQAVMGNNPSNFKNCGDNCPVESVSWNDVQEFISRLNEKITPLSPPLSKGGYRLPTEAEWEYAARSGGRSEKYSGGNDVDSVAWYDKNSGNKTHQVGTKAANGLGIYDMSGNVWEWIQDIYSNKAYSSHSRNNPIYTESGSRRVLRGGSWSSGARYVRAAVRLNDPPGLGNFVLGFRLAKTR